MYFLHLIVLRTSNISDKWNWELRLWMKSKRPPEDEKQGKGMSLIDSNPTSIVELRHCTIYQHTGGRDYDDDHALLTIDACNIGLAVIQINLAVTAAFFTLFIAIAFCQIILIWTEVTCPGGVTPWLYNFLHITNLDNYTLNALFSLIFRKQLFRTMNSWCQLYQVSAREILGQCNAKTEGELYMHKTPWLYSYWINT